jgi:hypothetical protein
LIENIPLAVRVWMWCMMMLLSHFSHVNHWIFACGKAKNSMRMPLLLTSNRHFTIALWMSVRQSANTSASLNGCVGPWWDVSRCALNLMEDILSTYDNCTLSATNHKLNVSGHMLIRTFFLNLVWGTRAQSLFPPFSYRLRKKKFRV